METQLPSNPVTTTKRRLKFPKVLETLGKKVPLKDGRALPYFLAWMLGVPASVLILIYLIRGH